MGIEQIREYSFKPAPWFYSKVAFSGRRANSDKTLYMGLELEVEFPRVAVPIHAGYYDFSQRDAARNEICDFLYERSGTEKEKERYFYLKRDSSVPEGVEIVSHPFSLWFHQRFLWDDILEYLDAVGCKSHDARASCGLHVHVNKSFFSDAEKVKLGIFVNAHKDEVVKLARRSESHYAKFKKFDETTTSRDIVGSRDRYEAVNFTNSKTIEFRLFKGTLRYETLIATLELVDAMCRFIKTESQTGVLAQSSWDRFLEYLREYPKKFVVLNDYMKTRGIEQ